MSKRFDDWLFNLTECKYLLLTYVVAVASLFFGAGVAGVVILAISKLWASK